MAAVNLAPRLYLVTPEQFDPSACADTLKRVLADVPVACVRLALSVGGDEATWTTAANHILPVCHNADVPLVITDHFRLVAPLGLDGAHLATSRTPLREVRKILGKDRIVGAFAGTSRHSGMTLAEAGADYISFGPIRETGSLGDETLADDDLLAWWAEMIETPIVAEGGVSVADATRLAQTADFVVPELANWDDADQLVETLGAYSKALVCDG